MPARRPLEERFWEKVDKNGPTQPHMETACWLWTAYCEPTGYGSFGLGSGKMERASRVSWVLHFGPIPEGLHVLHRCDFPTCTNPTHLFLGTHQDNMADMVAKGRSASGARSGQHTRPERTARGERHGFRLHPEAAARGDRHGFRLHPEAAARGERAGKAKLTNVEVLSIRARYKAGETQVALAKEFGLSSRNVCAIVRGETWKHLPI